MAITQEQANQLAAAYQSGDTSGLQGLVSQYGVTGADVQQYFPGFDVGTQAQGITLADAGGGTSAPDYGASVAQAYQNVLGRQADTEGLNYWTQQLAQGKITQQDLANQLAYGAQGKDILAAQQYLDKYIFDPTQTVQQAYQSVLGRQADQPGAEYWASQIQSGAVTPDDLLKILAEGSTGLEDRLKAQQYLGKDIFAPEDYLTKTKGAGYQDTIQYITENINDPVKVYQMANSMGVTPDDIYAAYQAVNPASGFSLQQIQDYFGTGQKGYEERFEDIVGDIFGTGDQRTAFEEQIGGRKLEDLFQSDRYAKMSIEDIESELGTSALNKYQSAVDTARYAANIFGADQNTQKDIMAQIMSGDIKDPMVEKAYKDLLTTNTLSSDTRSTLLREAAKANPNAPIFQNNPDLYKVYSPLGETKEAKDTAGQYGYYNNAPILSASEVDKVLSGKNLTQDFRSGRTDDNAMGWDLHSRDAGRIANGVAIFGVTSDKDQAKKYAELEDNLAKLGQVKRVEDPEGGYGYVAERVVQDEGGNSYIQAEPIERSTYDSYQDEKAKLNSAAEKLGVDPSQYTSFDDLYNAVQDKSKDLYAITGRTVGWDPNVAQKAGIQTLTADAGDMNHASVLYKREGDKLLAISDPKVFTANDQRRSGFAAQVAPWAPLIAIATLPLGGVGGALTQGIGALAGTTMPAYLPAVINAAYSTAMGGGDVNDFTRALLTQGATDFMSKEFTSGLQGLVQSGTISPDLAKELGRTGAGLVSTVAREGDAGDYLTGRGANYLFNELFSSLPENLGLNTKNMSATEKVLLSTLLPGVIRGQVSEKDLIKMLNKVATAKE